MSYSPLPFPNHKILASRRGFSLIEIITAIGIVSFALVILMGLLAVPLSSSRDSASEVRVTAIIESMLSDLRVRNGVQKTPDGRNGFVRLTEEGSISDILYDRRSLLTSENNAQNPPYYVASVILSNAESQNPSGDARPFITGYIAEVEVAWPKTAPAENRKSRKYVSYIQKN